MNNPIPAEFSSMVHDAMNHLYDSPSLEKHPLRDLLLEERGGARPAQELRRALLEAIRAMRPETGTPVQSRDWRAYRLLELRFISALSPAEVMRQLNLSRSFFFEEQARVLNLLIERLWNQRLREEAVVSERLPADAGGETRAEGYAADDELARLIANARWEAVDIGSVLHEQLGLFEALARSAGASVAARLDQAVILPRADRVLLRQALFALVAEAAHAVPGGKLEIELFQTGSQCGVSLAAEGEPACDKPSIPDDRASEAGRPELNLDVCRRLINSMGGRLRLLCGQGKWEVQLVWEREPKQSILVIDDNPGMAALVARYLAAENWQVISALDGVEARQRLAETSPAVILLDVMLPYEDGWELLLALKTAPETRPIPVIICSAIMEPQLVITLGGAAYLAKPLTQTALLEALRPWMETGGGPKPGYSTGIRPPG